MTTENQSGEPRARLSRERVLAAALSIADVDGIAGLSIRRLARQLDAKPMSLYYYVAGKDQILKAIVDAVVGQFQAADESEPWKVAIRRSALSAQQALIQHPWACPLLMSPTGISRARLEYMESLLGCLRRAGFSPATTDHAYHALDSHIIGHTLWHTGYSSNLRSAQIDGRWLAEMLERFPYLREHAEQHERPRGQDEKTNFEFGLDLILDGLEQDLERQAQKRPTVATEQGSTS